jgi:hypothetical protein
VVGVDVGLERPLQFSPSSAISAVAARLSNTGSIITASPDRAAQQVV